MRRLGQRPGRLVVAIGLALGVAIAAAMPAMADPGQAIEREVRAAREANSVVVASLGIVVADAASGAIVFSQQARAPLPPASTLKLVTAAAALQLLGPQYRFVTSLTASASLKGGVLQGDLVLVGGGDPTLTGEELGDLVSDLRSQGLTQIEGNLVVDGSAIATPSWEPGWVVDDLQEAYAPLVTGLSVDGALQTLEASPSLRRRPVADPVLSAGQALRERLAAAGIAVRGAVVSGRRPDGDRVLAEHDSAPLLTLLSPMNKESLNLWAEALFRTMGGLNDPEPSTAAAGARAIQGYLESLGVEPGDARVVDGSGLSRYDLITPRALARVLVAAHSGPDSLAFRSALPVAGVDGTLSRRFASSPLKGRLMAKTGTMSGICALAGYLEDPQGRRWVVVVMANGFTGPVKPIQGLVDDTMEAVWRALAAEFPTASPPAGSP